MRSKDRAREEFVPGSIYQGSTLDDYDFPIGFSPEQEGLRA